MKRTFGFFFLLLLILPVAGSATADMAIFTEEFPPFNYTERGRLTGVTTHDVRRSTFPAGKPTDSPPPWQTANQTRAGVHGCLSPGSRPVTGATRSE